MPGVGKSTVGVLLAKAMGRDFLDTDVLIQAREGRALQDIIDTEGLKALCQIEQRYVLSLKAGGCVIATGGSVVYSPQAMAHLASGGVIVHLELELDLLEGRLRNLATRGVVMERGQSLADLYGQRMPLYRKYAQITVDCAAKAHEQVAEEIIRKIRC